MTTHVRVELPRGLCALAGCGPEVVVELNVPPTQHSLLDALEDKYPALRGTIRDHASRQRRPFVRFFACEQDYSHSSPDQALPQPVIEGKAAFLVIGAIAGG